MIKLLITDVDGVLTDGKVFISSDGKEEKSICLKDLDALSFIKKEGIIFAIITGENNTFANYVKNKFTPDYFFPGCKEKKKVIIDILKQENISWEEVCYLGDGKYDIEVLKEVGLGVCPKDAIFEVISVVNVILPRNGGTGCLADTISLVQRQNAIGKAEKLKSMESDTIMNEINSTVESVFAQHVDILQKTKDDAKFKQTMREVILRIQNALKNGNQILFCGNGGSAADAQHLATEFVSRFYKEREALNAEALTVNSSALTAIANDYEYAKVFARQVEAKGKDGDILVGITTSGASENIIEAFRTAKRMGMQNIAFTGKNTQKIEGLTDLILAVPSEITPRIQEVHIMLGHIICECVEQELFEEREK